MALNFGLWPSQDGQFPGVTEPASTARTSGITTLPEVLHVHKSPWTSIPQDTESPIGAWAAGLTPRHQDKLQDSPDHPSNGDPDHHEQPSPTRHEPITERQTREPDNIATEDPSESKTIF